MTTGEEAYRSLQAQARSVGAKEGKAPPTEEYLTRHLLESFLHRLTQTEHVDNFVLKGGILLAIYGVRRPTKDVDSEAISIEVSEARLRQVVEDVAAVSGEDGVESLVDTFTVTEIREEAEYSGLRVKVKATVGPWTGAIAWDVSTGDPVVPAPEVVTLPRLLGDDIRIAGYRPETTLAEKGVTILQRGIQSTRWRDYIDIVQLFRTYDVDRGLLRDAAEAVATYRGVSLGPVSPLLVGYGEVAQPKWAAWRRKEQLEDISEALLDDQVAQVAGYLDPIFSGREPA